jgi:TPR repeat protein
MACITSRTPAAMGSLNLTVFKQWADQGDAFSHLGCGFCLPNGDGVSIDLKNAAHYLKLSTDQGNPDGLCLLWRLSSKWQWYLD